jgi:hypothetical protein
MFLSFSSTALSIFSLLPHSNYSLSSLSFRICRSLSFTSPEIGMLTQYGVQARDYYDIMRKESSKDLRSYAFRM